MSERAWIAEVGARGPLGLNSLQVTTAARAGKLEVRESLDLDKRKRPIGSARARFLPEDLVGIERLVRLGAPALREAGRALLPAVPLVVGIAGSERPDVGAEVEAEIVPRLARAAEIAIDEARSSVIRAGNASFVMALEAAIALLDKGAPAVLVGGVDSLVHPAAYAWLDAAHRLHAEGTEDGIIPAEAAAFVMLVPGGAIDGRLFRPPAPMPLAGVRFARSGREVAALDPDGPILAETLTSLVQAALVASGAPPAWVISDLDEMHRVREWSRVELRCHPVFEGAQHDRLPDLFGDVGAATGALAAAYACRGWSLGGSPRGVMLATLASDGAERGVLAIEEAR
ncbi:MAG: beta-ketoacyl synthase N-terminal-like domain-containing protein [Minicystis sp.]